MVILVQLVEVDQVGPMAVDESVKAETNLPRAGEIPDIFSFESSENKVI